MKKSAKIIVYAIMFSLLAGAFAFLIFTKILLVPSLLIIAASIINIAMVETLKRDSKSSQDKDDTHKN